MAESTPAGLALGLAALELVSAVALGWVGIAGRSGRLPRNRWAGYRSRRTLASTEAWTAAHRAGGTAMIVAAVPQLVAAVVIGTGPPLAALPFVAGGAAVLMGGAVIVGARQATRAAADVDRPG